MKKLNKLKAVVVAAAASALATGSAFASSVPATSDDFFLFYEKMSTWSSSGLAVGLSLAALIVGAGIGVAKSSPMPALGGVGLAAFFAFGPGIIVSLIMGGSVLV